METNDDEIIEQNGIEWIEKRKHDLIFRKYRLNTQQLIKEYQTKIQQQNRQIEMLMKEVKRQKFIIDTFSNENNETIDITTHPQTINGYSKNESDSEPEAILFTNNGTEHSGHKNAKEMSDDSFSTIQHERLHTKTMRPGIDRTEIERKKPSLLSIEILPNIQPKIHNLTNIYICDECNKPMSSRRVLAVRIFRIESLTHAMFITLFFLIPNRNTSEWFIVYKRSLFVTIVRKRFVFETV